MLRSTLVNKKQSHDTSPWRAEVPRGDERLKRGIKVKKRENVRSKKWRKGKDRDATWSGEEWRQQRRNPAGCSQRREWVRRQPALPLMSRGRSHRWTLCCSTAPCLTQICSSLSASSTSMNYVCVAVARTQTDTDTLPRKQARRCHSASVKAPVWPFQSLDSHSNC